MTSAANVSAAVSGARRRIELSFVIATRDRSAGCHRLCLQIEEQLHRAEAPQAEIVLVFDGCPAYAWDRSPDLYVEVPLASRHGIAGARNAGIEAARGQVLVFLDDDCVPAPGWIESLMTALVRYPDAVAFGGRVQGADHDNLFSQLRDEVYYRETFGSWYVADRATHDHRGTPYVNGGNSAYRSEGIRAVGGFATLLPAYSDVEMGRRLRLTEAGVLVVGMSIIHDHPATFYQYIERCYRSGRARGLLWRRFGYEMDSPTAVFGAITRNVLWENAMRRAQRVHAPKTRTIAVLFCQEVAHGFGYARTVLGRDRTRNTSTRRRGDHPPLRGVHGRSPQ